MSKMVSSRIERLRSIAGAAAISAKHDFATSDVWETYTRPSSDRNLPPDLDDLIAGQAEEIAHVLGIAFHDGKEPLLPAGQALVVLAADHGFMADIIGHVRKIHRASQRFAGGEELGDMRTLHETETRFGTPKIRGDLNDRKPIAGSNPRDR